MVELRFVLETGDASARLGVITRPLNYFCGLIENIARIRPEESIALSIKALASRGPDGGATLLPLASGLGQPGMRTGRGRRLIYRWCC
jgi:hypothetical protein